MKGGVSMCRPSIARCCMVTRKGSYNRRHVVETWQRNLRLVLRHIRFFRPWDPVNKARVAALEDLFRGVNRFLRDLEIDYWLVFGTLLGYHREGGIISFDYDIDFGAHERDYQKILKHRGTLPHGFRMYDTSHRHPGPKLYIAYKGWEADIYFYEERDATLQCLLNSDVQGDKRPFPESYVYPLRETTFLGEKTFIPNQVEPYLVHMYGYIGRDAWQDRKTGYWHPRDRREDAVD